MLKSSHIQLFFLSFQTPFFCLMFLRFLRTSWNVKVKFLRFSLDIQKLPAKHLEAHWQSWHWSHFLPEKHFYNQTRQKKVLTRREKMKIFHQLCASAVDFQSLRRCFFLSNRWLQLHASYQLPTSPSLKKTLLFIFGRIIIKIMKTERGV